MPKLFFPDPYLIQMVVTEVPAQHGFARYGLQIQYPRLATGLWCHRLG